MSISYIGSKSAVEWALGEEPPIQNNHVFTSPTGKSVWAWKMSNGLLYWTLTADGKGRPLFPTLEDAKAAASL